MILSNVFVLCFILVFRSTYLPYWGGVTTTGWILDSSVEESTENRERVSPYTNRGRPGNSNTRRSSTGSALQYRETFRFETEGGETIETAGSDSWIPVVQGAAVRASYRPSNPSRAQNLDTQNKHLVWILWVMLGVGLFILIDTAARKLVWTCLWRAFESAHHLMPSAAVGKPGDTRTTETDMR